ncbi:hypothetical protein CXG81DRAFT_25433 [Caulochytrium protostelioides]|uniref:60S acidic ribosomal protein P0 n=1 Tax=Caulochytrium protostelioides TaxID=1555241 RepID=A0A4V1IUV4_9FUNG|nr:hypothetical protein CAUPRSCDRAFT_5722 [Caulochytrium protostelioides]RKP01869.1 hypothetical protein CXG81DRAFT_25433 [Caulochytrium protostelioides]|eukprot:RKP01869.1 hypothetical protein CXG81DRAFT_25433 [Caulochytrium protostelioides]
MSKGDSRSKKAAYFTKLTSYLEEYPTIFVVNVDNVSSNQMHQIRQSLRGEGVVLMGKNTMVRRALRLNLGEHPEWEKLLNIVKGNIGFVFTKGNLAEIREKILSNRVQAPARAGAVAPVDVIVPAGNTGMEPGKTSFFQALGIPTKIARGTIEIVSDVHLITPGNKVDPSQASLLNMLNISPFTYGMTVQHVYDRGNLFDPAILDITDEYMVEKLQQGIANIAAISLAINRPTVASVPHSLKNRVADLVAVALNLEEYTFPLVARFKEMLADPSRFAAAAPAAASGAAAKAEEKPAEEEEESDDDMGFGLFD